MTSLAAFLILAYLAFVFLAESINPFVKPGMPSLRTRWRYARRMALSVLIGGIVAFALSNLLAISLHPANAVGMVVALGLALCFSMGRIRLVFSR